MARTKGAKDLKKRKRRAKVLTGLAIGAGAGILGGAALMRAARKSGQKAAERDIARGATKWGKPDANVAERAQQTAQQVQQKTSQGAVPKGWEELINKAASGEYVPTGKGLKRKKRKKKR